MYMLLSECALCSLIRCKWSFPLRHKESFELTTRQQILELSWQWRDSPSGWIAIRSTHTHTHSLTPIDKLDRLYTQPASLFLDKCSIMCLKQWGVHNSRGFPPTSCPVNESLRANYGHSNVTHITLNTQTHTVPVSHQVKLLIDKQQ